MLKLLGVREASVLQIGDYIEVGGRKYKIDRLDENETNDTVITAKPFTGRMYRIILIVPNSTKFDVYDQK